MSFATLQASPDNRPALVTSTPWLAILACALGALILIALPTLVGGTPAPQIHDEWGYLLSADTFAGGRWTNPTHPQWVHFETIHQFHTPSYQSKYPPAQALFLAFGQALWHPILGVWLSCACLAGALVWMLSAWLPVRWALGGGFLAVGQYMLQGEPFLGGTHAYWSQSYWGGAVAALGGALLFGSVARTVREPRVGTSLVMVCALLLLANSRPREGLLVALPAALYLLVWMVSSRSPAWAVQVRRLVLPVVLGMAPGAWAMTTYNERVTGDPLEMPWITHYEQYCVFPVFLWQEPPPDRDWRHPELAAFHGELELSFWERHKGAKQLIEISLRKVARFWIFFVGPLLTLLLFFLPRILRDPWMRFLTLVTGLTVLVGLTTFGALPHYAAPVAGPMLAVLVEGLRQLQQWNRRAFGVFVGLVVLASIAGLGFAYQDLRDGRDHPRHATQRDLEAEPGKHLAIVTYGPLHETGDEWIFNRADLDGAKVLWARDMGAEANQELIESLPDRKVHYLRVRFPDGGL